MKTKLKKLSKRTVSVVLTLVMLVSMAVVGIVNVSAFDITANKVFFLNVDAWSTPYIAIQKTENDTSSNSMYYYQMTRIPNTGIFYYNSGWNGYHRFFFNDTGSTTNAGTWYGESVSTEKFWWGRTSSGNSTMAQMNGTAAIDIMVDSTGTGTYSNTTNANCTATVSSINVSGTSTSSTSGTVGGVGALATASCYPAYGATVTYTASASNGYVFEGFSTTRKTDGVPTGAESSPKSLTSTMYNNTTNPIAKVYAYFKLAETKYDVTVSAGTGGKVSINDAPAVTGPTTVSVGDITKAKVAAVPDHGYTFNKWTVTGAGVTGVTNNSTTTPITALGATAASGTVTASFTEKPKQTVTVASPDNGTLTVHYNETNTDYSEGQTFQAYIDDTLTVTATPASHYQLDSLTAGGQALISGGTYTVTAGVDPTVDAAFSYATTYRIKVFAGAGGTTEFKVGSGEYTTIPENTAQNFDVDWESGYTVHWNKSSGYDFVKTTKNGASISTANDATDTGTNADAGALYKTEFKKSWPPVSGYNTTNETVYMWVAENQSLQTNCYTYYGTNGQDSYKVLKYGDKYWISLSADQLSHIKNSSDNFFVGFATSNSVNDIATDCEVTCDSTYNFGITGDNKFGTQQNNFANDSDQEKIIWCNPDSDKRSSIKNIGILVDNSTSSKPKYKIYISGDDSAASYDYDPFYIGGRFKINNGTADVYTGASETSFAVDSTTIKFTDEGSGIYSLNTGLTLADYNLLSSGEGEGEDKRERLFFIHDKVSRYGYANADYTGNSFHLNKGKANAITLNPIAGSLLPEHELLFNDSENTSNGIIKIWIDAKDYAEGNSASAIKVWYTLENETPGVADKLTFTASPSQQLVNFPVTLTATASGLNGLIDDPTSEIQFIFEENISGIWTEVNNGNGTVTGENITVLSNPDRYRASVSVRKSVAGTHEYRVRVTTTENYDGATALREVIKNSNATWNPETVYYTNDITSTTTSTQWTAIDPESQSVEIGPVTRASGVPYTFALSDKAEYNATFTDFTILTDENKFCDITMSYKTVTIDDQDRTVRTYVVTPRTACSNPTIYINAGNRTMYAVATFDKYEGNSKTTSNTTETVRYYFAKKTTQDKDGTNNLDGTKGLHIKYFNNSVTSKNATKWAVPVKADGTTSSGAYSATSVQYTGGNEDKANYQITIDESQLFRNTSGAAKKSTSTFATYNVYVLEMPIWATSANICNSSGTTQLGSPILSLNPNRIYVFWSGEDDNDDNDKQWSGVPLDKSFWVSENKRGASAAAGYQNNQVPLKNFKTNLINYNTDGTNLPSTINNKLSTLYNSSNRNISRTLYWGMFANDTSQSFTNWDIALNLAQRNNDQSYYASVWESVNAELSEDILETNPLGGGLLTAYGSDEIMPFFDYEYLGTEDGANVGTAYTNKDFPFYKSEYDGVVTYSYDSMVDLNRQYNTSGTNSGKYTLTNPVMLGSNLGYAPFNGVVDGFANEYAIDFYMTSTGTIKGTKENHDISFNFSGDDDVWVFVDGVLVLDLGGDHKISAGSINFSDMKVYYKTAAKDYVSGMGTGGTWATDANYIYTMDLDKLMKAYGRDFNPKDATTSHKLQMFYMERGRNESNLSLSFNLPQASGLNVRNTVTATHVNAGLKDAAMQSSNGDFFTYQVANMTATDAAVNALKNEGGIYANALLPSDTGQWAANTSSPVYPSFFDVTRVFGNETFWLAKALSGTQTGGSVPALNDSTYSPLAGTVYMLSDKYAQSSNERAEVTGKTASAADNNNDIQVGDFHLLGGQMANFADKVQPNSFVKVLQRQNLGDHGADSNGILEYEYVANNYTHNYYNTSVEIYDEAAKKNIGSGSDYLPNYLDTYYANDDSSETNAFYFTNYANDPNNTNPAMTVNFYNDIAVGEIRVAKELTAESSVLEDFCFKVEFCNVFGDEHDTTWSEYNIDYQIYDIENDALVSTSVFSYGDVGLVIKPGQYARILGVPVETRYRVTEVAHASYSLANIDKTTTKYDGSAISTITGGPASGFYNYTNQQADKEIESSATFTSEFNNNRTSEYISTVGSDKYYTNMIPIVSESHISGTDDYESISTIKFTNKKENFTIQFMYYDRYMINGLPAGINTSASTYSRPIDSITAQYPEDVTYFDNDPKKGVQRIDYASIISKCAVNFAEDVGISNVMCDYNMWTSQAAAKTAMQSKQYFVEGTPTAYTAEQAVYHTNSVGQPNSSGEKWVTYYDSLNKEITKEPSVANNSEPTDYLKVRRIVVWCYNYPKQYDVDVYGADSYDDLLTKTVNGQTVYVANANGSDDSVKSVGKKFYYNQRFGDVTSYGAQDEAGFISNYGIPGTRSDVCPKNYAANSFTKTEGGNTYTYTFAYWAYDQAGTQIASVDKAFMYRVSTDTKIYAVYTMDNTYGTTPGVSLSANDNDTYVDSDGISRTRLNILASVYNAVPFDTDLQKMAFVNISLSSQIRSDPETYTPEKITYMFEQYKGQLKSLIEFYENKKDMNAAFSAGVQNPYTGHSDNLINLTLTTKGFIYTITSNGNEAQAGEATMQLTNKNRVQFTMSYKSSALNIGGNTNTKGDTCLVYAGALKYNGTWNISNNCLIYRNGVVADNSASSWS